MIGIHIDFKPLAKCFPACKKYQQELGVDNCGAISLEKKKKLVK